MSISALAIKYEVRSIKLASQGVVGNNFIVDSRGSIIGLGKMKSFLSIIGDGRIRSM